MNASKLTFYIGEKNFESTLQAVLESEAEDSYIRNEIRHGELIVEFGFSKPEEGLISPMPSSGSIGRKNTAPPTTSSSKSKDQGVKLPSAADKTGIVPMIECFTLFKGQIYFVFSSGGRYNKMALRLLLTNQSYDMLDVAGVSQYAFLSGTGMHTRKMNEIKLGRVYKFYNLKYYSVSDDVRILNYKAGSYAALLETEVGSDEFINQLNFGGTGMGISSNDETCAKVTGTIRDIAMGTICNCIQIKGPVEGEQFIRECGRCSSNGMLVLNDEGAEYKIDGSGGPISLVSIDLDESMLPVQLLVHPNYTRSLVDDFNLETGDRITADISRLLNARNLTIAWRITGYVAAPEASGKYEGDKKEAIGNGETAGNDLKMEK